MQHINGQSASSVGRTPRWALRAGTGVAVAAAASLVLAACGSSSTSTTSASGGGSNGVPCGQMKIGIVGPLTGSSSSFGAADKNSAVLAIEEYNVKHSNCKVSLVDFDTQGAAGNAPAAAQKAVQNPDIVAILGPEFSGENQAALPIFNQAGMPTVTSDATNGALSSHGWKVFHRTVASDYVEGPGEAVWTVQNAALKSVAVIDNGQAYGQGIAKTYAKAVTQVGGKVAMTASINANASDYSSTVLAIKGSGADAVYCGCLYAEAARLLKQLREGGITAQYISDAGAIEPDFGPGAGQNNAEGAVAGQTGVINGQNALADALFAKYVKQFGADAPQTYVAEGYDAAQAILMAITAGNHTRSSINSYLNTISFDGASGHVQFKPNGDRTTASMNMMKYTSGKWAFLVTVNVPANLLPSGG